MRNSRDARLPAEEGADGGWPGKLAPRGFSQAQGLPGEWALGDGRNACPLEKGSVGVNVTPVHTHTHTTYGTVSVLESEAETERSRQRRWVEPAPQREGVPASSWGSSLGCGGQCAQGPSGEVEVRVCGVST